jgi:acryloyl-coenzyme A reductase
MTTTQSATLPTNMHAVAIERFGPPNVLQGMQKPIPAIGDRDILVKVAYCGVCRHDLLTRSGAFPSISLPVTLGHQVSGWVAGFGSDVTGFEIDDRIMTMIYTGCGACVQCLAGNDARCLESVPTFLGEDVDGGYAEYVAVRSNIVLPVPPSIRLDQAAVITCTLGTALHACTTRGAIAPNETVVVTGASGGVGLLAVQVAKAIGARVIGVTSSETHRAVIEDAGADEVIVSNQRKFASAVKTLGQGKGADVVVEVVGTPTLSESIHALAQGGRVIVVGNVTGEPAQLRPAHLILKELSLIGTKSCTRPEIEKALAMIAAGTIKIDVGEVVSYLDAEDVHRRMEAGENEGRIVLEICPEEKL